MGDKQLRLPENTVTVDTEAFMGSGVTTVIVPEGTTKLAGGAFAECDELVFVYLPSTLNSIADNAFAGSDHVVIIADPISYAVYYATLKDIPWIGR